MNKLKVLKGIEIALLAQYRNADYPKKIKILRRLGSIATRILTIQIEREQVNHINEKNR